jgi:hypothetical protein
MCIVIERQLIVFYKKTIPASTHPHVSIIVTPVAFRDTARAESDSTHVIQPYFVVLDVPIVASFLVADGRELWRVCVLFNNQSTDYNATSPWIVEGGLRDTELYFVALRIVN